MTSVLKLSNTEDHVKNYRPQLLVLVNNFLAQSPLIHFTSHMTKGDSLLLFGHILSVCCHHVNINNLYLVYAIGTSICWYSTA